MKLLQAALLVIVTTMLSPTVVLATDGNELLGECIATEKFLDTKDMGDESSMIRNGLCLGKTQGVRHTMQTYMESDQDVTYKACFPEGGLKNEQAVRVVTKFLRNNPEVLHYQYHTLTMMAYIDAYPCK